MNRNVRRMFLFAAALMCVTALGVGARAVSSTMFKPPVPPVIAVIDLQVTYAALDELKAKELDFQARIRELEARLKKMKENLDQKMSTLDAAPDGEPRALLAQELIQDTNRLKFEEQLAKAELDDLQGEALRSLYTRITAACDKLAKDNGYTMVLASDETVNIPRGGKADVTRAISMRRMLYVENTHDITQDVISMVNNNFAAGGGKAPAAPAPNGKK